MYMYIERAKLRVWRFHRRKLDRGDADAPEVHLAGEGGYVLIYIYIYIYFYIYIHIYIYT